MTNTIPLLTIEAQIKRQLRAHLRRLGFVRTKNGQLSPPNDSKDCLRALHRVQRQDRLTHDRSFVDKEWPLLPPYFANGTDVDVPRIAPRLELIESETWQSRLFRLAGLTWSVPVSQGYGRRMRFLVWDDNNGKLRASSAEVLTTRARSSNG